MMDLLSRRDDRSPADVFFKALELPYPYLFSIRCCRFSQGARCLPRRWFLTRRRVGCSVFATISVCCPTSFFRPEQVVTISLRRILKCSRTTGTTSLFSAVFHTQTWMAATLQTSVSSLLHRIPAAVRFATLSLSIST